MNLSPEFRDDKNLSAKILQACRAHPANSIAYSTIIEEDTKALIIRLSSNITTWKTQKTATIEQFPSQYNNDAEILSTDRR